MIQPTPACVDLAGLLEGMDVSVPSAPISDITSNSRHAARGGLFLACAGIEHHGLEFVAQALEAGVAAVAWEPGPEVVGPVLPSHVAGVEVPGLSSRLGTIADRFFNSPSASLSVTGVTGTNGKTTSAFLVTQALNHLSRRAGYMGTLGFGLGSVDLTPSSLTTPGCITMHRRLREMADAGADHVIAEISSHALDQHRVDGIRFRTAALTNLSRDHLDYHGSMERYAEAKARLFVGTGIRTAVLNVGDRFGAALADQLTTTTELISVALVNTADTVPAARLMGRLTAVHADGLGLQLSGDFGEALLSSSLWGRFNAENLVLAVGILLALDIEMDAAVGALSQCVAPPGRMELIRSRDSLPTVVVDFAHTPDALGQALQTVRDHCSGKVWCVFGCGGDRDKGKRRLMGEVAASMADRSVITDDNPRDEDPEAIIAEVIAGTGGRHGIEVMQDRQAAIEFAIGSARSDDVVLIAGKGHENVQIIGSEARAFSDKAVARVTLGLAE
jgi:UDP-N-acetylmuramoyl-L-alanyl-D-glutamate--2,6-diaminopimelate ligase